MNSISDQSYLRGRESLLMMLSNASQNLFSLKLADLKGTAKEVVL